MRISLGGYGNKESCLCDRKYNNVAIYGSTEHVC